MESKKNSPENPEYVDGEPRFFSFKNDYIFTEVMKDKKVLKGFLVCLTGIDVKSIKDITILPRHLDKDAPSQKLGILDCKLELNDDSIINIELQILCFPHWDSRSLYYLSKMLTDQYHMGPDVYSNIKRCIHICILDFNYTDIKDDFYNIYKFRDEEGHIYSDLMEIHVIQLKKRNSPGVAEKYPSLFRWTQLFSIKTRKELESMTEQDEDIRAAAQAMNDLNLDAAHRDAAFYRFLYLMDERTLLKEKEDLKLQNSSLIEEQERLKKEIERQKEEAKRQKEEAEREKEAIERQNEDVVSQLRVTFITILEDKFGPVPDLVIDKIGQQKDFSKMNRWLTQAYLAGTFSQFIEAVPELSE